MDLHKYIIPIVFCVLAVLNLNAQGPPILGEKPIMLGGGSVTFRSLVEIRKMDLGTFSNVPLMVNYLPSEKTSIELILPYLWYDLASGDSGSSIADIQLVGKYQFYRKDDMGKTFRVAFKTTQVMPTGEKLDLMDISTGIYQGFFGIVAGYETLQYGISNELGYVFMPGGSMDGLRHKMGFGLPLLKPQYPNKQVNLYFEYANVWLPERSGYQLLYAQGVQYARKNVTFDLAIQAPLVNDVPADMKVKYSLLFGGRYTF